MHKLFNADLCLPNRSAINFDTTSLSVKAPVRLRLYVFGYGGNGDWLFCRRIITIREFAEYVLFSFNRIFGNGASKLDLWNEHECLTENEMQASFTVQDKG